MKSENVRMPVLYQKVYDIGSEIGMRISGGEEFVMKILVAVKDFTRCAHLMTDHLEFNKPLTPEVALGWDLATSD